MARKTKSSARTELRRVMRMAQKFITGDNYLPGSVNPENLTERQLRNIRSKKDLVRRNIIKWNQDKFFQEQGEKEEARMTEKLIKKVQKQRRQAGKAPSEFYTTKGDRLTITIDQSAEATVESILKMIDDGISYHGELAKHEDSDGFWFVNSAARALRYLFDAARNVMSDKEIVERLKREFGSIKDAKKLIKSLILSVYDKVYAVWADGQAARSADFNRLATCLGQTNAPEFM